MRQNESRHDNKFIQILNLCFKYKVFEFFITSTEFSNKCQTLCNLYICNKNINFLLNNLFINYGLHFGQKQNY